MKHVPVYLHWRRIKLLVAAGVYWRGRHEMGAGVEMLTAQRVSAAPSECLEVLVGLLAHSSALANARLPLPQLGVWSCR